MDRTNESRLRAAILAEIADNRERPDQEIAAMVAANNAALVASWAIDRMAPIVHRLKPAPPIPFQDSFPFHDLSVRIPTNRGAVELGPATIGILRESAKVLLKKLRTAKPRANSLLARIQNQIELMEPWAYQNRKITVEKVRELITGGAATPVMPKRSKMSDAMRLYWAGKTAEERTAIARRRVAKRRATSHWGKP